MTIEERIARLERQARYWRISALTGIAALIIFLFYNAAPDSHAALNAPAKAAKFNAITTGGLFIVNNKGEQKASLFAVGDTTYFTFDGGSQSFGLTSSANGVRLSLNGDDNELILQHDSIEIIRKDPLKEQRFSQLLEKASAGGQLTKAEMNIMESIQSERKRSVLIGTTSTGGVLSLHNQFGEEVVSVQSDKTNQGEVYVRDVKGNILRSLRAD